MIEQRQFQRVKLTQPCALAYQEDVYHGHLENISLNGAVISLDAGATVPVGGIGLLTVYLDEDARPLKLNVEVIHNNSSLLGVKFIPVDEYGQTCLLHLVEKFTCDTEKLISEMEAIREHIANFLRKAS